MVSSIRTFLLEAQTRDDRGRFIDVISGGGGVGFIFKTEDLLPTVAIAKYSLITSK